MILKKKNYTYLIFENSKTIEPYLINKIGLNQHQIIYYPDILFDHPFKEKAMEVLSFENQAIFQTPPHQLVILEVPHIAHFLEVYKDWLETMDQAKDPFYTLAERTVIDQSVKALRLSVNQKIQFEKACIAAKLRQMPLATILHPYTLMIIKNKFERNQRLNQLLNQLYGEKNEN